MQLGLNSKLSTPTSTASNASVPAAQLPDTQKRSLRQLVEYLAIEVAALGSWRRYGLAFLLGCLSALALPPVSAMPLLWLIYPLLLWLLDGVSSRRQAFFTGWCFGFGQFVAGLYWLSYSLFVDIGRWWWALPFAVAGLPALLAFYCGFATLLWWTVPARGTRRLLAFASIFVASEWLRGHLLTGFPWNLTAHGWIAWAPMLQSYALMGAYGLGLITLSACLMPALFGDLNYTTRRAAIICACWIGILLGLGGWGAMRLTHDKYVPLDNPTLRIVQPNIAETDKRTSQLAERNFATLLTLSRQPAEGAPPSIIVWPESALPWPLDLSPSIAQAVSTVVPPGGLVITGAIRRERDGVHHFRYYNSLEAIDTNGAVLGHYDKVHLAPFGEYMPLRKILPLNALAVSSDDFTSGDAPQVMRFDQTPPFAPLICYEAAFPESIPSAGRPQWLLNITNDGWFGNSAGPRQHLAMARARAVEQGIPLVRSANTGISAVVDAYGIIIKILPLQVAGVIDFTLPPPLSNQPVYGRIGDFSFLILLVIILLYVATGIRQVRIRP